MVAVHLVCSWSGHCGSCPGLEAVLQHHSRWALMGIQVAWGGLCSCIQGSISVHLFISSSLKPASCFSLSKLLLLSCFSARSSPFLFHFPFSTPQYSTHFSSQSNLSTYQIIGSYLTSQHTPQLHWLPAYSVLPSQRSLHNLSLDSDSPTFPVTPQQFFVICSLFLHFCIQTVGFVTTLCLPIPPGVRGHLKPRSAAVVQSLPAATSTQEQQLQVLCLLLCPETQVPREDGAQCWQAAVSEWGSSASQTSCFPPLHKG